MSFTATPNKLDSAFVQRNTANQYYEQINVSGSDLIFYHSSSGIFTADQISVWAAKYGIGTGGSGSISASYAITASYALSGGSGGGVTPGGSYNISCSYASGSTSSSFATSASYITASNIAGTITSASYAISASYAPQIPFPNTIASASWASSSISSSQANTASFITASNVVGTITSASFAISASYAPFSDNPNAISASWASSSISSSYADTASYALNAGNAYAINFIPAVATSASWVSASVKITTADTASYVTGSNVNGEVLSAGTATTATSSSFASESISASYSTNAETAYAINFIPVVATSASWVSASVKITTADTASYINASNVIGIVASASYATTSSYMVITMVASASWASSSISSSQAATASLLIENGVISNMFPYWNNNILTTSSILQFTSSTLNGNQLKVGPEVTYGDYLLIGGKANFTQEGQRISADVGNLFIDTSGSANKVYLNFYGGGDVITNVNGGKLGVNTSAPNAQLDVNGNIHANSITSSLDGTASWANNVVSGRSIMLCSAYTPLISGPDIGEVPVPYSPLDGTTSLIYTVRRLVFRVQTSANDTSIIAIEKSTGTGGFSATTIGSVTLSSGSYEAYNTGSLGTINSGDKLRFNITTLGSAQNWITICEISSP
jgi:hypothetical protein